MKLGIIFKAMSNSDTALREFAEKWGYTISVNKKGELYNTNCKRKLLSDLTALISEHIQEMFKFIKWIGFYSTTLYYRDVDEKWLRTRFDIEGCPTEEYDEYTTDELFNYWKENEQ